MPRAFAFTGKLRHEADGLSASSVDGSSGEKQIAHEGVAKIAFQARNAAEAGDESETQFGKAKRAILSAISMSQARASSSPPPRQAP